MRLTRRQDSNASGGSYQSRTSQSSTNEEETPTLFDRLGGEMVVKKIIDDFYGRIMKDKKLAPFFSNSDFSMERLKVHQLRFFEIAFGDGLSQQKQQSKSGKSPRGGGGGGKGMTTLNGGSHQSPRQQQQSSKEEGLSAFVLMQHRVLFQEHGLNEKHFDLFFTHLGASFQAAGISQQLIDEVALVVIPLRPYFQHANEMLEKEEQEQQRRKQNGKKLRSLMSIMKPILMRMSSSNSS